MQKCPLEREAIKWLFPCICVPAFLNPFLFPDLTPSFRHPFTLLFFLNYLISVAYICWQSILRRPKGMLDWTVELWNCVKRNCRIDLIVFGDQKNYSSTADWSNQTSLVFLSPVLLIRMNSLMADEKPCSWSDKEESPRCFHCCALVFSKACYRPNPPLSPIISLLSPLELQKCILFR